MCKLNDKTSCIDHIKTNNTASYNPYDICNAFAEHFALIGKNLAQKIPSPKKNIHDCINKIPRQVQSLYLSQTPEQEVKKLINELPNKTSSGYDDIHNILLQTLADLLASLLNHVFNLSISQGIFPNPKKIVEIIPFFQMQRP